MGIYVNPTNGQNKQEFLKTNCRVMMKDPLPLDKIEKGCVQVCLVDNGTIIAAGVVFDEFELDCFKVEAKSGTAAWFVISLEKIKPHVDAQYHPILDKAAKLS